mgnify:CR=1 FL=1
MTASFGEFGKVYRIGGDEFVVIVTQKPDELDAMTKHFDSSVAEWRGKIVDSYDNIIRLCKQSGGRLGVCTRYCEGSRQENVCKQGTLL